MLDDFTSLFFTYLDSFKPYAWQTVGALTVSYLTAVQLLRWRHYNNLHKQYEGKIHIQHSSRYGVRVKNGNSSSSNGHAKSNGVTDSGATGATDRKRHQKTYKHGKSMSPATAQKILNVSAEYDMPGIMEISLSIALFKTYAIPSISKILQSTKQLSVLDNGSKRYSDTGILISTWIHCPVVEVDEMSEEEKSKADPRAAIAIARVNWLHSKYKINNEDYIYTLSLFILEPIKWAKKYGWRELSPLEQEAFFVFWYDVGVKMGIKDIPDTLDDLWEWSENFENAYMLPAESNRNVSEYTFTHFARMNTERFGMRRFMRSLVTCFLEERVRVAMMQPEQPVYMHRIASFIVEYFRFKHRYLSLPRLKPKLYTNPTPKKQELEKKPYPRQHPNRFSKEPWYAPEPRGFERILQHLRVALGLLDPEYVPGPKFKSEGYRLEECGPVADEKVGHEDVYRMAEEMQGCPIVGPWGRRA